MTWLAQHLKEKKVICLAINASYWTFNKFIECCVGLAAMIRLGTFRIFDSSFEILQFYS